VRSLRRTTVGEHARRALTYRYVTRTTPVGLVAPPRSSAEDTAATSSPVSPTRFMILCQARTGSSLVQLELQRRWSEMRCLGEEYGAKKRGERPDETFADVTARVFTPTDEHPVVGCKIF